VRAVASKAGHQPLESFEKQLPRIGHIDSVVSEFPWRHTAPDTELETAMGEVIKHADLLEQTLGSVQGKQVHERAKADTGGLARNGRQEHARTRSHAERSVVVFSHLIDRETEVVSERSKTEMVVVQLV
jgi:hypothetical protein